MKAKPARSISLNYSSLPPQLTLFRAIRSRHFILAFVCAMTLLANLLATAFAGILIQDMRVLQTPAQFYSLFDAKLTDPLFDPFPRAVDAHLMALESNHTQGTHLPAWTDEHRAYLPMIPSIDARQVLGATYKVRTKAFEASLNCEDLNSGLSMRLDNNGFFLKNRSSVAINMTVQDPLSENTVLCGTGSTISALKQSCVKGNIGAHFSKKFYPISGINATQRELSICDSSFLIVWVRFPQGQFEITDPNKFLDHISAVGCQSRLEIGDATVVVNPGGSLQEQVHDYQREDLAYVEIAKRYLDSSATYITGKALNNSLLKSFGNVVNSPEWHCDNYAYDSLNYFLLREANSTRFLDANQNITQLSDVGPPLERVYKRLFAVWFTLNRSKIFPQSSNASATVPGYMYYEEERLLFKTPLVIISEIILGIYIVAIMIVYSRRPGKYLPHLPMSIAAIITYFAASTAVRELNSTAHMNEKDRTQFLKESGFTYGYGSYVGPDGRTHVGIERAPFVMQRKPLGKVDSFC